MLEYAQAFTGNYSLYEKNAGTGDLTLVDSAAAAAGDPKQHRPKAGYLYKILFGQGSHAPGGEKCYLTYHPDGESLDMTQGYALVAWPAAWDKTGRNTFMINNNGTVYQKDFGPGTPYFVALMTEFDPDETWVVAE